MSLQIVQLTDTHLCAEVPQRKNDLEQCIRAINALRVPADLVIHTGDITHNGSAQEYHMARSLLDQLNAPYFVMAGNRDNRTQLRKAFYDKRFKLPSQGWVQYSIEDYSTRLIMLDSVSDVSNKGELCDARLQHLKRMLLADLSKPVALFIHHPPYEAAGIPDPYQYESWVNVEQLTNLLADFENIGGMYCGHVHRFIDGTIAGIQASAITCLASDLRRGHVSDADRKLPVFKVLNL